MYTHSVSVLSHIGREGERGGGGHQVTITKHLGKMDVEIFTFD